jgi:hypothetical protein
MFKYVRANEDMSANAFIELLTSLQPADRHTAIRFHPILGGERDGGRVYVNFVNLPPDVVAKEGGRRRRSREQSRILLDRRISGRPKRPHRQGEDRAEQQRLSSTVARSARRSVSREIGIARRGGEIPR